MEIPPQATLSMKPSGLCFKSFFLSQNNIFLTSFYTHLFLFYYSDAVFYYLILFIPSAIGGMVPMVE